MTSMLLTDSSGRPLSLIVGEGSLSLSRGRERDGPSALLGAVPLRVVELLGLLDGGRLQLRADDVAHRLDPVGDDLPLLAVPLLDQRQAVALVVVAGHAQRPRQP